MAGKNGFVNEWKDLSREDFERFLMSNLDDKGSDFVSVHDLSTVHLKPFFRKDVHLLSTLFILVLSGKGEVYVNRIKQEVYRGDVVLLSFGQFFNIKELSRDFTCVSLYVSKDYVSEMFSSDMLYKRVKYGVKMFKNPVLHLATEHLSLLVERTYFLRDIALDKQHFYHKEMTLNALRIFFLDLSNIIEQRDESADALVPSHEELYFQRFLELLALHYKSEHRVDFYADAIHITPHYLTLIVKKLTGQTVSDFIYELVFSEAKLMLQRPAATIQDVAAALHFSDQSAFGKFFKRRSGLSPKAYKGK